MNRSYKTPHLFRSIVVTRIICAIFAICLTTTFAAAPIKKPQDQKFSKIINYIKSNKKADYKVTSDLLFVYSKDIDASTRKFAEKETNLVFSKIKKDKSLKSIWSKISSSPLTICISTPQDKHDKALIPHYQSWHQGAAGFAIPGSQYGMAALSVNRIMPHELGHIIYFSMPSDMHEKVSTLFKAAKTSGKYGDTYAMKNEHEYFASATGGWFNPSEWDGSSNYARCNGWLKKYDSELYNLISKLYNRK